MTECHYNSCEKQAVVRLRYDEPGTPVTRKPACRECANTEQIHDPFNVHEEQLAN